MKSYSHIRRVKKKRRIKFNHQQRDKKRIEKKQPPKYKTNKMHGNLAGNITDGKTCTKKNNPICYCETETKYIFNLFIQKKLWKKKLKWTLLKIAKNVFPILTTLLCANRKHSHFTPKKTSKCDLRFNSYAHQFNSTQQILCRSTNFPQFPIVVKFQNFSYAVGIRQNFTLHSKAAFISKSKAINQFTIKTKLDECNPNEWTKNKRIFQEYVKINVQKMYQRSNYENVSAISSVATGIQLCKTLKIKEKHLDIKKLIGRHTHLCALTKYPIGNRIVFYF